MLSNVFVTGVGLCRGLINVIFRPLTFTVLHWDSIAIWWAFASFAFPQGRAFLGALLSGLVLCVPFIVLHVIYLVLGELGIIDHSILVLGFIFMDYVSIILMSRGSSQTLEHSLCKSCYLNLRRPLALQHAGNDL
jgi:hypothetical protein